MLVHIAVLVILIVAPMKALCQRDRPNGIKTVKRICDMRKREGLNKINKSMPSGDTAAAAFFCGVYWLVFGWNASIFICAPPVALGRVYV